MRATRHARLFSVPCGRLSWLSISLSARVKKFSYRIVACNTVPTLYLNQCFDKHPGLFIRNAHLGHPGRGAWPTYPEPSCKQRCFCLCSPCASTRAPQWHLSRVEPSRRSTPILTASSSSLNPHDDIGIAWSQSPLCGMKPAVPGAQTGRIVLAASRPEECQRLTATRTDMTVYYYYYFYPR